MRGSPELLTCDLSENKSKALPPSLLPRTRTSLECMPDTNRSTGLAPPTLSYNHLICFYLRSGSDLDAVMVRQPRYGQDYPIR
jgi:hypothetical protein